MTDQLLLTGLEPPAPIVPLVAPWDPDREARSKYVSWTCPMCWTKYGALYRRDLVSVAAGHRCPDSVPALILGPAQGGCRVCGEFIACDRDGNPPKRPDGQAAWSHPECEPQDEPFRYPVHMSKFAREMAQIDPWPAATNSPPGDGRPDPAEDQPTSERTT